MSGIAPTADTGIGASASPSDQASALPSFSPNTANVRVRRSRAATLDNRTDGPNRSRAVTVALSNLPEGRSTASGPPAADLINANRARSGSSSLAGRRRGYTITERLFGAENGNQAVPLAAISPEAAETRVEGATAAGTLAETGEISGGRTRAKSNASSTGAQGVHVIIPGTNRNRARSKTLSEALMDEHHHEQEVDLLDVLDQSVSTTAHLANIQNAFVPKLFSSRQPVIELSPPSPISELAEPDMMDSTTEPATPAQGAVHVQTADEVEDEADLLDLHLAKLLKKQRRKDQAKEMLKGIWAFMKTPIGWLATIYAILVVVDGAALVILLIIPSPQGISSYAKKLWVEICSQIMTGLFCVTTLFPLPWRLVDAYNIATIWWLARADKKRRAAQGFPPLRDPNDLPDPAEVEFWIGPGGERMTGAHPLPTSLPNKPKHHHFHHHSKTAVDTLQKSDSYQNCSTENPSQTKIEGSIELGELDSKHDSHQELLPEIVVLSDKQEAKLRRCQEKFARSQGFYRPHTTPTHHATSLNGSLWISILMVGNSLFQVFLCGVMWGLNRFNRPAWTTALGIVGSFGCGIAGAILIWQVGERSKRKAEVTRKVWKMLKRDEEEFEVRRKEVAAARLAAKAEKKNHANHSVLPHRTSKESAPNHVTASSHSLV